MFNEGFNDARAPEGVWSHHEHLVLLHGVEERSHVGPDRLHINKRKNGRPFQAQCNLKPALLDIEGPYTLTFLGRREPLRWTFFNTIWRFALGALA